MSGPAKPWDLDGQIPGKLGPGMIIPVPRPPAAYLDELEAALYMKVKPNTLRSWRVKGGGPRFRLHGTNVVYSVADLDSWSDGRAKLSTSDVPEVATGTT